MNKWELAGKGRSFTFSTHGGATVFRRHTELQIRRDIICHQLFGWKSHYGR
ncbi:hypothetical protein HanIR_Chr17g0870411 [Helianthus annuus]|nr:hypothetical protein HanIR_Chr17g0870411 [Helianthus annuus]